MEHNLHITNLDITNEHNPKPKRKIYPNITNLSQHTTDECETDQHLSKSLILFSTKTATFQSMAHYMYTIDIGITMLYGLFLEKSLQINH